MASDAPLLGVSRSLGGKAWRLKPADDRVAGEIERAAGCSDALARLLAARGVTAATASAFLAPRLRDSFPDPSSFTGMDACAALIWDAIERGVRIALFADYDVDGATSAAQLHRWLGEIGAPPLVYVPDRIEEGYGPNAPAFASLKAQGAELVITLDCGAASVEPIAAARGMGLTVGVVDHHLMSGPPPEAAVLVNPNQPGDASGCGHMAAAGVVFVLLAALNREGRRRGAFDGRREPDLLAYADLAALGTICDVVPLTGINRAIAAQGLKIMSAWGNPGLAALAEIAAVTGPASAFHAGFLLGPRINAGGRVGRSDLGVRLLTTDDPAEARRLAQELDQLNAERRAIESEVLEAAIAAVEARGLSRDAPVLIASGEGWHPGVIGIAAGRLKDRYNRPSIVIGVDPETGLAKGSGRSCPGVDLGTAVSRAREAGILVAGGGHAMACGLTIAADRIAQLEAFLTETLAAEWAAAEDARAYAVDAVVHPAAVDFAFCDSLSAAAPFGAGNSEPRFALADLRRTYAQRVGSDHVRFTFEARSGARLSGVAFRCADDAMGRALLAPGEAVFHAAGKLKADDSRYGKRAELHLEDLASAG